MAHIDNEFNKRFSNQQLLDDGFDAEGLWNAISEDLDSEQTAPNPSFLTKKRMLGLLLLLLIGGLSGVIYFESDNTAITQNTANNIDNTQQNDALVSPSNSKKNTPLDIQTNTESANKINTISQKNELKKSAHSNNNIHLNPFSTPNNTQKITSSEHTSFTKNTSTQTTNSTNKTDTQSTPSSPITNSSNTTLIDNVITENSAKPLIENSIADSSTPIDNSVEFSLFALPSIIALVESKSSSELMLPTSSVLKLPENEGFKTQKSQTLQWNVGLSGGINTLRFQHQSGDYSDLVDLKNSSAKQDFGTSYGLHAGLQFKDRWSLHSGIEYHQIWSKFDYEKVEQIQVLKEDQLLRIWIDASTGDTLNMLYGDTLINTTSTRTVLHHNEFQRISIPLEIGVQESRGKFTYGITAGTVFSFTNKQSGRTLDASSEIVNFNENDITAPYKPFDIGLRISPLVGYQLSENMSLTLRPQWTWNQNTN